MKRGLREYVMYVVYPIRIVFMSLRVARRTDFLFGLLQTTVWYGGGVTFGWMNPGGWNNEVFVLIYVFGLLTHLVQIPFLSLIQYIRMWQILGGIIIGFLIRILFLPV